MRADGVTGRGKGGGQGHPGRGRLGVLRYKENRIPFLSDVLFALSVYFEGQSNMKMALRKSSSFTDRMAELSFYARIRMLKVEYEEVPSGEEVLQLGRVGSWASPSDEEALERFSAVCFLFAKNLIDLTSERKVFPTFRTASKKI